MVDIKVVYMTLRITLSTWQTESGKRKEESAGHKQQADEGMTDG